MKNELSEAPDATYSAVSKVTPESNQAQQAIAELDAEYWFGLSKWAKERGLLQGWERSIAYSLGKLAAQGKVPSPKQAIQGERIAERASGLGYTGK